MRLILVHVDPGPRSITRSEQAAVVVPGAPEKVAFDVPVVALERFLGLVGEATRGVGQRCAGCGGDLAAWPGHHERNR